MTTYVFPSITPTSQTFELITNTRTYSSPLTNAVQTAGRRGALWKATLAFNNLQGDDRATMQAFVTQLNGQEHRFLLHDHSYTLRGAATGNLRVAGAGQTGNTLTCDGANGTVVKLFKAGDYITQHNQLHIITADVDSNSSGQFTLPIAPELRSSPTDNQLLTYTTPVRGVFMLASPAQWKTKRGLFSDFTITAIEDVLA